MTISYGWTIVVRELETSSRWSPEAKARAGVIAGLVISVPVVLGTAVPYGYWLLTGNGPWRRHGFSSFVVVHPFPKGPRAEIRAALGELFTAATASSARDNLSAT
jgi:hypothetical protein